MARRIVFIVPALIPMRVTKETPHKHRKLFTLPYLGLLMLAAVTPEKYEIEILNEHIEPLVYEDIDADVIGITVMTPMAVRAYEIADEMRKRGKIVILGGMHPTFCPDEAMLHADSVVQGEAEETWGEVLEDLEGDRLKKIYPKRLSSDLQMLPLPKRSLISHLHNPIDVIQATRGCPYRCSFCSVHNFHDHVFRKRPVSHIIEELQQLQGTLVAFVDDNIAGDHVWAKELFHAMIPLRKKWFSMASFSVARDDELLKLARISGCLGFFIGIESMNEMNLEAANKSVNRSVLKDYAKAIKKMHSFGLGISAGTVYGFDHDTVDVFPAMLKFAQEVRFNMLQVSPLTPFPGTHLFEEMRTKGRDLDLDWSRYNFYDVTFTPRLMTKEQLLEGMNFVRRKFYSYPSIARRIVENMPHLGLFSTCFNVYLNLSYRYNQRRGFQYPP